MTRKPRTQTEQAQEDHEREYARECWKKLREEVIDPWFKKASECKSPDALLALYKELTSYSHDYNTIVEAMGAFAVAACWTLNGAPCGGITGFQASAVMWSFIQNWMSMKDQPMRLVDYSNMLYPQYGYKFQKVISCDTWEWLQKEAKRLARETASPVDSAVIKHWKKIADGELPFGYSVSEEL